MTEQKQKKQQQQQQQHIAAIDWASTLAFLLELLRKVLDQKQQIEQQKKAGVACDEGHELLLSAIEHQTQALHDAIRAHEALCCCNGGKGEQQP